MSLSFLENLDDIIIEDKDEKKRVEKVISTERVDRDIIKECGFKCKTCEFETKFSVRAGEHITINEGHKMGGKLWR